jgi:hypothetical protein
MRTPAFVFGIVWFVGSVALQAQEPAGPTTDQAPPPANASEAAPPEAGVSSSATEETQRQLQTLTARIAELERQNAALDELRQHVEFLKRDNAALAEQVRGLSEGNGRRILANLNTDSGLRHQLAEAANPRAAVKFYNWSGETARMNVNGSWYNLQPGATAIRVAYGPVAVTHCDKQTPRTFTEWTPADGGFVMVFDVGQPRPRATARR